MLEFWFIATHGGVPAATPLLLAKLLGLGVTAFVFDVTRDKLLQMGWFRRAAEQVMALRDWLTASSPRSLQASPARSGCGSLQPRHGGRLLRRILRIRRAAYRGRRERLSDG